RQEQRDSDQDLVRRRGLRAEALADEAQDDQDAREAGDREQQRRHERDRSDEQKDLDGVVAVDLHRRTVRRRSSSIRPPLRSTGSSVAAKSSSSRPASYASRSL